MSGSHSQTGFYPRKKPCRTVLDADADADSSQLPINLEFLLKSIPAMAQGVLSDDPAKQLEATIQFRKLLMIEGSSPIDEVIKAGVIPRFVKFLGRDDLAQLQFEAACVLTNVTSGSPKHSQVVIKHDAVPMFVHLLSSANDEIREQAVWALGNVAGDSPSCRDIVLGHGALMPLLGQLNENSRLSMLRPATRTISNLCKGMPLAPFEQMKPALPVLRQLIDLDDLEVLTYACQALSCLSYGDDIQAVIEAGVCPRLVNLLRHASPGVALPALRALGNIAAGEDAQTQFVIDNNVLPCLYQLLTQNYEKCIKKAACRIISNITAGNKTQIQAVIDASIIPPLVQLLEHGEIEVKEEAARAVSNVTSNGSHSQIRYLVSKGCIRPLCDLLISHDQEILIECLDGLENIILDGKVDQDVGELNVFAHMIDECGGLNKIDILIENDDSEVSFKALMIREDYFGDQYEEARQAQLSDLD